MLSYTCCKRSTSSIKESIALASPHNKKGGTNDSEIWNDLLVQREFHITGMGISYNGTCMEPFNNAEYSVTLHGTFLPTIVKYHAADSGKFTCFSQSMLHVANIS